MTISRLKEPGVRHHLFGNVDQRPVGCRGGDPASGTGASSCTGSHGCAGARRANDCKSPYPAQLQRLGETTDQTCEKTHHVLQQRAVDRMMNIGLDHRKFGDDRRSQHALGRRREWRAKTLCPCHADHAGSGRKWLWSKGAELEPHRDGRALTGTPGRACQRTAGRN
jgi:hypothetical protein